jgi:PHP family Zn ribbon phosphoesterase
MIKVICSNCGERTSYLNLDKYLYDVKCTWCGSVIKKGTYKNKLIEGGK